MQPPCPDLTKGPPRSPRERLAGVVHLPRLLDKARARSGGRLGEYIYPCPLDQKVLGFLELEPEAVASLNPAELDRLGLTAGEPLRVTTRRGTIELTARADPALAAGMIFIPFCYAEAAANLLTNPQLDPVGKIPEFKFCAARVEKAAHAAAAE